MHFVRPLAPVALAASLLLAACGDDPAPAEGPTEEGPAMPQPTNPAVEPAPLPAEPVNVAAPPAVEPEQQILDDADATGMTARVDRTGDVPPDEDGLPANAQ